MKKYLLLITGMVCLLLGLFAVAQALEIPLLTDPRPWLGSGGWIGASVGVALLVADVLVPVPSSLVMIAHGAAFGVAVGTLLSTVGSLGAAVVGFALGRRGGPLLARWISADERERVGGWLERRGGLAIVVSRPIPVLAETVAVLAGTTALTWSELVVATLVGSVPASFLYALSGAAALRMLDSPILVFGVVLLVATPAWLLVRSERLRSLIGGSPRCLAVCLPLLLGAAAPPDAAPAGPPGERVAPEGPEEGEEEEGPAAAPLTVRESITVTASRREKAVYEEPATVHVVSREDLELRRKVGNFVDVLAELPAVSVQKTAIGHGSPFIRGFTGFHNLLLIDGIRFNNSVLRSGPNQYWATLDSLATERVELVKGAGSALYGSDAVGGTVNVLTPGVPLRDLPVDGRVYSRWSEAERARLLRAEAQGGREGLFGYLVGASFKDYGDLRAGGDTGVVENSGFGEWGVDAKLRYRPRDDRELTVVAQTFRQEDVPRTETTVFSKSFRGTAGGTELRRDHDQERFLAYVRYSTRHDGPVREAEYTLAYQATDEERIRVQANRRSDLSGFSVGTWSAQAQFRSPTPWGLWTYGVETTRDSVDSFRTDFDADGSVRAVRIQGPVADDASYDRLGVYVQNELSLLRDRLTLILGGRYSFQALDADRVEDPVTGEEISLEDDWAKMVGSIRLLWQPDAAGGDRWHLFASVSQAFRAPNLSDLTAFDATSAAETPTPGLRPESFLTSEVGIKTRLAQGSFTGSYFYTVIEDEIVQSPTGRLLDGTPEVQKSNVGDGHVQGVEMTGSWWVRPAVELWGNLSWMEGEVEQIAFDGTGEGREVRAPVSRLVPWMGNGGVRYQPRPEGWWIELHGTAFSDADRLALRDRTDTRRIPPGGTPGFAVFGIRGGAPVLRDRLTLAWGLENLLDEEYRIHGSGQNMPGRGLVASLAWEW